MRSKILGLLAVGLLAGPMTAHAISGTWYFNASESGTTYSGQFSFTDLDPLSFYEDSQAAGFTFSADFPIEELGGIGFYFDSTGQLMIGGLRDTVNGAAPGDFILYVYAFPDAIEFSHFSFTVSPEEEFFTVNVRVSTEPIAAPEPATLALLSLGLVGLGLSRRRKA